MLFFSFLDGSEAFNAGLQSLIFDHRHPDVVDMRILGAKARKMHLKSS